MARIRWEGKFAQPVKMANSHWIGDSAKPRDKSPFEERCSSWADWKKPARTGFFPLVNNPPLVLWRNWDLHHNLLPAFPGSKSPETAVCWDWILKLLSKPQNYTHTLINLPLSANDSSFAGKFLRWKERKGGKGYITKLSLPLSAFTLGVEDDKTGKEIKWTQARQPILKASMSTPLPPESSIIALFIFVSNWAYSFKSKID